MAATLAILGADIRTMDPDRPRATALAMDGETIVAVGDDAEVRQACDAKTELLDGTGWHLTPGLTDGHQHLVHGATIGKGIDFDRAGNFDRVRSLLADARDRSPGDAWLRGYALEYEAIGGRYHHRLVDDVTGDRPMFVFALDLHTGFVNGAALRAAGITGERTFADGASIVVDDAGLPTGELRERSAMDLVLDVMPEPTAEEALRDQVDAIHRQNALGITAIHQMDGDPAVLDALAALEAAGQLSLHVAVHNVIQPTSDAAYVDELLATPPRRGRRWRSDGIKFWLDGVVETGTAWLEHADDRGGGTAPNWPSIADWEQTVRRCHDAGFRIATHAIGDRAVRETLDVYGRLPDGGGGRHRIEHIETAPDPTVARFRPQRVTASVQPIHLRWLKPDRSDPWSQRLDHEQCRHAMPSGDLSAAGALVVLGSDWPVAPYDPRIGMFAAQLRRSPDVDDPEPVGASRPLSGLDALAGYTVNAARAIGEDDRAGLLRPGYRADAVAWAEDVARCDPHDLPELPVLLTVQAGRIVHRAAGSAA